MKRLVLALRNAGTDNPVRIPQKPRKGLLWYIPGMAKKKIEESLADRKHLKKDQKDMLHYKLTMMKQQKSTDPNLLQRIQDLQKEYDAL